MRTVFVDTAAWLGLLNGADSLHPAAQRMMRDLESQKAPLVTTEFVLVEVADALASPQHRSRVIGFLNDLRRLPTLRIVPATAELMAAGWDLYQHRLDKDWGLTDCTSFAVMQREGILEGFTSDHHFTQAGFTCLL